MVAGKFLDHFPRAKKEKKFGDICKVTQVTP
jgi:hypothetical protein